jgi:hypothetical protein
LPRLHRAELTQSPSEVGRQRIADGSALRRLPEVDDVARMAEYLLGEPPQYHRQRIDDRRRQ